jgi:hypothetical protein
VVPSKEAVDVLLKGANLSKVVDRATNSINKWVREPAKVPRKRVHLEYIKGLLR